MPLYEYQCETCGHRFEVIQKFSDPPLEQCPKCGAAVRKLQSAPAFHLKGTGWYITDYAKKDAPGTTTRGEGGSSTNKDAPASSAAKSDGDSESKSEGKSDGAAKSSAAPESASGSAAPASTPTKTTS